MECKRMGLDFGLDEKGKPTYHLFNVFLNSETFEFKHLYSLQTYENLLVTIGINRHNVFNKRFYIEHLEYVDLISNVSNKSFAILTRLNYETDSENNHIGTYFAFWFLTEEVLNINPILLRLSSNLKLTKLPLSKTINNSCVFIQNDIKKMKEIDD